MNLQHTHVVSDYTYLVTIDLCIVVHFVRGKSLVINGEAFSESEGYRAQHWLAHPVSALSGMYLEIESRATEKAHGGLEQYFVLPCSLIVSILIESTAVG